MRCSSRTERALAGNTQLLLSTCLSLAAWATPLLAPQELAEARRTFRTQLTEELRETRPLRPPPPDRFELLRYAAPSGRNWAYLSVHAPAQEPRPAIVWLTGGFPPARGGVYVWAPGPTENDQSASAYRAEGVVMFVPTVRGTANNPGVQEAFLGEVDDVIAAARHLRSLEGVDPERIYLGGHSSGATLALLVAESTDLFRGVVAFGPVGRVTDFGGRTWPFDATDPEEVRLRSPLEFLGSIRTPTLVVEGSRANVEDLELLDAATDNPHVTFVLLEDEDHFTPLAPVNRWLARRIASGTDALPATADEVEAAVRSFQREEREARDLRLLEGLRAQGHAPGATATLEFTCRLHRTKRVDEVSARFSGFALGDVVESIDDDEAPCLLVRWRRDVPLTPEAVFEASAAFRAACRAAWVKDLGWALAP